MTTPSQKRTQSYSGRFSEAMVAVIPADDRSRLFVPEKTEPYWGTSYRLRDEFASELALPSLSLDDSVYAWFWKAARKEELFGGTATPETARFERDRELTHYLMVQHYRDNPHVLFWLGLVAPDDTNENPMDKYSLRKDRLPLLLARTDNFRGVTDLVPVYGALKSLPGFPEAMVTKSFEWERTRK